jgi:hypothetical protein
MRGMLMGVSTSKWTTPDPYLGFGENDTKLYTNFEFCEEKIIGILKTHWFTKPLKPCREKKSKTSLHILEDGTSGVQVGDIEQAID